MAVQQDSQNLADISTIGSVEITVIKVNCGTSTRAASEGLLTAGPSRLPSPRFVDPDQQKPYGDNSDALEALMARLTTRMHSSTPPKRPF